MRTVSGNSRAGRSSNNSSSSGGGCSVGVDDRTDDGKVRRKVVDVLPDHGKTKKGAGIVDEKLSSGDGAFLDAPADQFDYKGSVSEQAMVRGRVLGEQSHQPSRHYDRHHHQQDPELTWVCSVWGVLARVRPGDKLAFLGDNGRSQVDLDIDRAKLWTPMRRALRGDTREALLTFVPTLVGQTLHLSSRLQGSLPVHFPTLVLSGVRGLENLRHTYALDARFLARFDASLASIRDLDSVLEIETETCLKL